MADYPLRERPRAQLMLALYRCGRQADALRVYQEFRRYLAEEVGLEPSSELQELDVAIATRSRTLDWAPTAPLPWRAEPSGTVTFLFTDIEGSTKVWESTPESMRKALARHDDILRSTIEAHGGYVFSTAGDGLAAAFHRAGDALDAATRAQQQLAREHWPDAAPIRVRMGLHTGEVEERGGDYLGPAVNRAARIMAAGHGGQVLDERDHGVDRSGVHCPCGRAGRSRAPPAQRPGRAGVPLPVDVTPTCQRPSRRYGPCRSVPTTCRSSGQHSSAATPSSRS